ncbi:MAG: hypothetical protein OEZ42_03285, partial [Gemmatimonadota bacterium]|nr:hypothetical protein [Gemmatimonadota bacterium]
GTEFVLELHSAGNGASLTGGGFDLRVRPDTGEVIAGSVGGSAAPFDTALLWRMTTAWDSIFMSQAPNAVNPEGGA